jgi:hypothetical protein
VERIDRETVEMYAQDRRARAQDVFLPLRRLCGRRPVSRVVILTAATKSPHLYQFLLIGHPCLAGGDGGSGRGRRRGGAGEVRRGVRRPQPRARILLPQLVPEVRFFLFPHLFSQYRRLTEFHF